jgi:hypothetical protein
MSHVERGVLQPPNQEHRGDRRANGFVPLMDTPGVIHPFDGQQGGDRRNGTSLLNSEPSPVHPPDHRFHVDGLIMREDPCAVEPGRGAIPVEPTMATTQIVDELVFIKTAGA